MGASGDVIEVEAPIHRVTVFPNGALVVRRGRAGPGRVRVRGLPLLFSSDSLRVRPARGAVADLEETCALEVAPQPEPPSEEERLALEQRDAQLDDELRTTEALIRVYENLRPEDDPRFSPSERLPDAERWLALLSLSKDRLTPLEQRREQLAKDKRALARKRRELERLNRGDPTPPRFLRGVSFALLVDDETAFDLEYFVEAARWVPSYSLKLDGERAELTLSALVAQASGEDWSSAELRFSTANLARETTLPELSSWRIGRAQPSRRPAFRPLPDDLERLFDGYEGGAQRRAPPAPAAPASLPPEPESEWDETTSPTHVSIPAEAVPRNLPYPQEAWDAPGLDDFDEVTGAGAALPLSAPPSPPMVFAPPMAGASAPPRAAPAPGARGGDRMRRAAQPHGDVVTRARPEPLPPRLRYAYLRLMGPDEPGRGTLRPLDPLEHLWSLVEDHQGVDLAYLRRAVDALKVAAASLRSRALPAGTSALDQASFHHVYAAPGTHDLASDGDYHRVVVDRRAAPSSTELRGVPREADDIYRFCVVETPPGVPYPRGPLQVYEDGAFRVTTSLETTGGGRQLELNLGVEPAVRVVGRTAHVDQQEKGLVSQSSRVEHKVRVQVRSSLPGRAHLVLYDRLPVPRDGEKDIEVKLDKSDPPPVRDDKDPRGERLDGGLKWRLELEPGRITALEYRYTIALPAKAELVGGNRRE